MPVFGNNGTSAGTGYIGDSLYGHFDAAFLASWGLPVPPCVVTQISLYANGSPVPEVAVLRFGIYDANVGAYTIWPLMATSPTFFIPTGAPVQWWSVDVNIPLAGGLYALSVLDVNGPAMTWSAGCRFTVKANGMSQKSFVGGVFPDPLGVCSATTLNLCLYAEYLVADTNSPTAACCCLPHGNSNMNM
jgi:hypothetical protein